MGSQLGAWWHQAITLTNIDKFYDTCSITKVHWDNIDI